MSPNNHQKAAAIFVLIVIVSSMPVTCFSIKNFKTQIAKLPVVVRGEKESRNYFKSETKFILPQIGGTEMIKENIVAVKHVVRHIFAFVYK